MRSAPRRLQHVLGTLASLAMLATATVALSGCNTLAGAGQDVSSVGHDLTGGAAATQSSIHSATGAATH